MIYDIVISDQAEIDLRGIRQYELEPWKSRGLRVAPVDNYLVLYIPDDDTQVVTIIRVLYGGRDVNTQLNRFTKTK